MLLLLLSIVDVEVDPFLAPNASLAKSCLSGSRPFSFSLALARLLCAFADLPGCMTSQSRTPPASIGSSFSSF